MSENHKLDNPVWNCLNETHEAYALEYGGIKFYKPEYCPFGGFVKLESTTKGINQYAKQTNDFYVVGQKPQSGNQIFLKRQLICNQMIIKKPIDIEITEVIIELKTKNQKDDLSELVNLVQPGFFGNKTADLGRYFGIYKTGKLIAAAGERMKMEGFTEISAVVTHPEHTRKGYAKQLIKQTAAIIFEDDKIPFLHVAESNINAVKLYEKLGFFTRAKMNFWHFNLAF